VAWPQPTDYNEAIQTPRLCFADAELRAGEALASAHGLPRPYSGNFADVYQIRSPDGRAWAVKCFTREVGPLERRYQAISDHLSNESPPFMVRFQFLNRGIRIRGSWFPVLKMDWVDGFTLNDFVRQQIGKPALLYRLAKKWVKLSLQLRRARIAHGDLQHGNVLLVPGDRAAQMSLRLIDYDGMYVPGLAQAMPGEFGHPNYQHPERAPKALYDPEIDRFAHLAIYTALRCLTVGGQELLEKYDNGDNLLFRESDFLDPSKSVLLAELWQLPDPDIRRLLGHLLLGAHLPANRVVLLEDVIGAEGRPLGLTAGQEHQVMSWLPHGTSRVKAHAAKLSTVSLEALAAETADESLKLADTPGGSVAVAEASAPARTSGSVPTRVDAGTPVVRTPRVVFRKLLAAVSRSGPFLPGLVLRCRRCKLPKHLLASHCPACRAADVRLLAVATMLGVVGACVAWVALPRNEPGIVGIGGALAVWGALVALPVAVFQATYLMRGSPNAGPDVRAGPQWPTVIQICPACGTQNVLLVFICRQCGFPRWERVAAVAAVVLLLGISAAISEPRIPVVPWWGFLVDVGRSCLRVGTALASLMLMIGSLEALKVQVRLPKDQQLRPRGRQVLLLGVLCAMAGFGLLMFSFFSFSAAK
jgi:hypothetical protein